MWFNTHIANFLVFTILWWNAVRITKNAINTLPYTYFFSKCLTPRDKVSMWGVNSGIWILILFSIIGRGAELLLQFCQTLKEQFQFSWRMISLVDVILRYAKKDQAEAWRQIDEGIHTYIYIYCKTSHFHTNSILRYMCDTANRSFHCVKFVSKDEVWTTYLHLGDVSLYFI